MSFESRLSKLKIRALNNVKYTFITSMLVNLNTKYEDKPYMAKTNYNTLYFGQQAEPLPDAELTGLMFHELMHCVLRHNDVGKGYENLKRFNLAADFYIDMDLIDSLDLKLPTWGDPRTHHSNGGHYDPQFKGLTIREIYDLLPEDDEENSPSMDDIGEDSEAIDEILADELISTAQIMAASEGVSTGSSVLDRMIKDLRNPSIPWEQLLEQYVTEVCREGRSYRRLNRRYDGFFMPTPTGKQLGKISLSFDLSCSVTDDELTEYVGNIKHITNIIQPKVTEVVSWSTQIHSIEEYHQGEDFAVKELESGGGTNPQPMLDYYKTNCPEVIVIFTDGEFWSEPDKTGINCPIVWVIVNRETFDHGGTDEVIYINTGD